MRSFARRAWGYIKVAWWAILLILGVVSAIIFRSKDKGRSIDLDSSIDDRPPSFSTTAREKINQALIDVRIEKEIAKAKTRIQREELKHIRQEKDGSRRRENLAAHLKNKL